MDDISDYRLAAGAIAITNKNGQEHILLLRRSIHETSFHGLWELPGGKLENNESPFKTAITELYEETGIHANNEGFIQNGCWLMPHRDHNMKKIYYGFIFHVDNDAIQLSEEHDDYIWLPMEKAINIEPLSHHAHFLLSQMMD